MPYASKQKKREVDLLRKKVRHHCEPGFAEARRKKMRAYYAANREKIIARVVARRAALRAAAKAGKK